jgi:hypothetical protein
MLVHLASIGVGLPESRPVAPVFSLLDLEFWVGVATMNVASSASVLQCSVVLLPWVHPRKMCHFGRRHNDCRRDARRRFARIMFCGFPSSLYLIWNSEWASRRYLSQRSTSVYESRVLRRPGIYLCLIWNSESMSRQQASESSASVLQYRVWLPLSTKFLWYLGRRATVGVVLQRSCPIASRGFSLLAFEFWVGDTTGFAMLGVVLPESCLMASRGFSLFGLEFWVAVAKITSRRSASVFQCRVVWLSDAHPRFMMCWSTLRRWASLCESHVFWPPYFTLCLIWNCVGVAIIGFTSRRQFARVVFYGVPMLLLAWFGVLNRRVDGCRRDAQCRFASIVSYDIPILIYAINGILCPRRDALRRFTRIVSNVVPRLLLDWFGILCWSWVSSYKRTYIQTYIPTI